MWRDNWSALEPLLAAAVAVAHTAVGTSATLAAIVVGTAALVVLFWYLIRRHRRRD